MARSHLSGLLACSLLLLAAHHASASPAKRPYRNPIVQADTCPVTVQVGKEFQLALVPLQGSRMFELKPSQPEMSVRLQGDDMLYKASVDGTMIKLLGCDALETNCTMLDEGGSKSSDLLTVDEWNGVEVKYIGGEVTVDVVNMKSVMSQEMPPMKGPSKGTSISSGGYVTFTVPPSNPSYTAILKIHCDDNGQPPFIKTEPPTSPASPTHTTTPRSSSTVEQGPEERTVPTGPFPTLPATTTMHSRTRPTPTQGGFVTDPTPTHGDFVTDPTPTQGDLVTKDSIVDTSTPAPASGISRDVGIVVGVLLGVLLIIAIAIAISMYRKRQSAIINEHARLQETSQQQQQY